MSSGIVCDRAPVAGGRCSSASLAFVVLLAAWIVWGEDARPTAAPAPEPQRWSARLHRAGGRPVPRQSATSSSADLLFVGDSRIHDAIVLEELDDAATLWGPGAYLPHLLPVVERYPARTVVVGISFLSLAPTINPLVAEALRHPAARAVAHRRGGAGGELAARARGATRRPRRRPPRRGALHLRSRRCARAALRARRAGSPRPSIVGCPTGPTTAARASCRPSRPARGATSWFEEARPDQLAAWAGATALSSKRAQRDEAAADDRRGPAPARDAPVAASCACGCRSRPASTPRSRR